jgi:hypothetical protein
MDQFPIPKKDDKSDQNNGFKRSKETKGKMPDFILMDDTQDYLHENYQRRSPFESKENLPKIQSISFPLRLLSLLGMMISFFVAIGTLFLTVLFFVLAALLFFQNQALNAYLRKFWTIYIHSSVLALGLGIAAISPTIGLGLLLIYFSFQKESREAPAFQSLLNRFFKF